MKIHGLRGLGSGGFHSLSRDLKQVGGDGVRCTFLKKQGFLRIKWLLSIFSKEFPKNRF